MLFDCSLFCPCIDYDLAKMESVQLNNKSLSKSVHNCIYLSIYLSIYVSIGAISGQPMLTTPYFARCLRRGNAARRVS